MSPTDLTGVQRPLRERHVVVVLLIAVAVAISGSLLDAARFSAPSVRLVLAVIALLTAGAGCLIAVSGAERGAGLTFTRLGGTWVCWYLVSFGVASLAWLRPRRGTAAIVEQAIVPMAVLLALLALLAWLVGYLIGPPRGAQALSRRLLAFAMPPGEWALRFRSMAVLIYLVGLAARMFLLRANSFAYLANPQALISSPSSLTQVVSLLEQLTKVGLTVAAIDHVRSRSARTRAVLGILLATEIGFGLYSGTKAAFILSLIGVVTVFAAVRQRLTARTVAVGVVATAFCFNFTAAYRPQIRSNARAATPAEAARLLPGVLASAANPARLIDSSGAGVGEIGVRIRQVDNIAIVIQKTPSQIPHVGLSEFVTAPVVGFVPRALWPSKPVVTTGLDFSRMYYDLPPDLYTSSAVTIPGDLYRHGGLAAVLGGMFLLGSAVRLVDQQLRPSSDLRSSVLFIAMLVLLANIERDVVGLLMSTIPTLIVAVVATRLAFRTQPS